MKPSDTELDHLENELARVDEIPAPQLLPVLDRIFGRLKALGPDVSTRRIDLLFSVVSHIYLDGRSVVSAAEPIALAAALAERARDASRLRRALSIQGLVLSSAGHVHPALQSLLRSLRMAEELDDSFACMMVWANLGVVLIDSTLFVEARHAFLRANAIQTTERRHVVVSRARAYHGLALCSLNLRDIPDGIAASQKAVDELGSPSDREEEQLLALIECVRVELLVHARRFDHAQASAQAAMLMAARSESSRARIEASSAYGLVQVATGDPSAGLSRIKAAQREAQSGLIGNRLTCLRMLVQAHELLGRPDEALAAYRELVKLTMQLRVASLHGSPYLPDSQASSADVFVASHSGDAANDPAYADLSARCRLIATAASSAVVH